MFATIIFALLLFSTTGLVNPNPTPDYHKITEELYQLVINGHYDTAVSLTKILDSAGANEWISGTIQKLLDSHYTCKTNIMSFAYKLWSSGTKLAKRHLPATFKNILNQDSVKIVNKDYELALKLDQHADGDGDSFVWVDSYNNTNHGGWKLIPVWVNDEVKFKIYQTDRNLYLKLVKYSESNGDRKVLGGSYENQDRFTFYLEPHYENGGLVFFIINCKYPLGLKLNAVVDDTGHRRLMAHNGDLCPNMERSKWIITEL